MNETNRQVVLYLCDIFFLMQENHIGLINQVDAVIQRPEGVESLQYMYIPFDYGTSRGRRAP
jgi:hypothetical protein